MSKELIINGKNYKLKFAGEAVFDSDCLVSLTNFFGDIASAEIQNDAKLIIKELAKIPQIVLTVFYAGLKEYHGMGPKGDKSIPDKESAKALLITYISDHKKYSNGNFLGIMGMLMGQMQEDGFLGLIGLGDLVENKKLVEEFESQEGSEKKKKSKKKGLEVVSD